MKNKIRYFIILISMLTSSSLIGQNFFPKIKDLTEFGAYQNEEELLKIFRETNFLFGNVKMIDLVTDLAFPHRNSILSSCYLFDIDNDNLTDLIYYGWGISVPEFKIFLRKDNELKPIFQNECISLIDFKNTEETLNIKYLKTSCGGNDVEFVDNIMFSKGKSEVYIEGSEKTYFYAFTILPETRDFEKRFIVKNETYNLRYSPDLKKDNIIGEFTKGDIGTAFSSSIDSTGRVWWFVQMDNNISKPESSFDFIISDFISSNEAKDKKWYGWISSRYVDAIE